MGYITPKKTRHFKSVGLSGELKSDQGTWVSCRDDDDDDDDDDDVRRKLVKR